MCQTVVDEGQKEANDGETRWARNGGGSGFVFWSGMETSIVKCPGKATRSQPENEKGDEEENAETKLETRNLRRHVWRRNEGNIRIINSHFLKEVMRVVLAIVSQREESRNCLMMMVW